MVDGGGPAAQQVEGLLGPGAGLGRVDQHGEVFAGQFHGLEGEVQVADDGVVQLLAAGAVEAHVVGRPPGPERLAAGRQLADEVGERLVVGVAARLGAQHGDDVVGGAFPVDEELLRAGVQEHVAGVVGRAYGVGQQLRVKGVAEPVGRQQVVAGVPHPRRGGYQVEDALHARTDPLAARPSTSRGSGVGGPGQVEQVGPLGIVELQRPGQGVEHLFGHAVQVAPLKPDVVVGRDASEVRNFLPTQALDPAVPTVDGEAGLLRRDPGPA